MKIIVCGAGSVGKSIVGYLAKGNNDIVIIDNNRESLDEISQEFDIQPVLGTASSPETLAKAGAKNANLLIAATDNDEVNILACEFAHKLFNVSQKIARVNNEVYLKPEVRAIFEGDDAYINLLISPDEAIAEQIYRLLKVSGSREVLPVFDKKMYVIGLKVTEKCPFLDTPLTHMERVDEDIDAYPICVLREKEDIILSADSIIKKDDIIYLLTPKERIFDTIHSFGAESPVNERVIIFGGNDITKHLGDSIEKDDNVLSCKIVEEDEDIAEQMSQLFTDIIIIQGPMTSDVILNDAGIKNADMTIAITDNDKDNLLVSMLAEKEGAHTTVSLVNTSSYDNLLDNIGSSILVDRSSVTISKILREIRKVPLDIAYSIGRGFGEIWQVDITADNKNLGKKIQDLHMPEKSKVCAIFRNKIVLYPSLEDEIREGDKIIIYVSSKAIRSAEKIF